MLWFLLAIGLFLSPFVPMNFQGDGNQRTKYSRWCRGGGGEGFMAGVGGPVVGGGEEEDQAGQAGRRRAGRPS